MRWKDVCSAWSCSFTETSHGGSDCFDHLELLLLPVLPWQQLLQKGHEMVWTGALPGWRQHNKSLIHCSQCHNTDSSAKSAAECYGSKEGWDTEASKSDWKRKETCGGKRKDFLLVRGKPQTWDEIVIGTAHREEKGVNMQSLEAEAKLQI